VRTLQNRQLWVPATRRGAAPSWEIRLNGVVVTSAAVIDLPDQARAFEIENAFHLSAPVARIGKMLAHYELLRLVAGRPGAIVECGVFKAASFARFAAFRDLIGDPDRNPLVAFDTFDEFPPTALEADQARLASFVAEAGSSSIGVDQLRQVLCTKGIKGEADLIAGDICETVPVWADRNPGTDILLLHVDVDIYEPSKVIFECLWPKLVSGGVMILDDYGRWEGETQAFHEYFGDKAPEVQRLPFIESTPVHVIKP